MNRYEEKNIALMLDCMNRIKEADTGLGNSWSS
jgi:hypothetical protein